MKIASWMCPAVLAGGLFVTAPGCALYKVERDLPGIYAEFLNQARYLITADERKTFLYTPDAEKDGFIEEFWKRRDPDPETAENELRTEYLARISRANELFRGEGVLGWLTDRGRIHVLFGPPTERQIQPQTGATRVCREAWTYVNYTLVFEDATCTGTYRLLTFDLGPILHLSLNQTAPPGGRGRPFGQPAPPAHPFFDFTAAAATVVRSNSLIEGAVKIEIPYRRIWFKSEGGRFRTTFDVSVEIRDSAKALVWDKKTSVDVDLPEAEVEARIDAAYVIEVPVLIDQAEAVARVGAGPGTAVVIVVNRTGSETVKKSIEWK